MPCFMWFTHEMNHSLCFWKIKIEISFHSSVMSVRRHRIPYVAWQKFCKTHLKLTSFNNTIDDKFI